METSNTLFKKISDEQKEILVTYIENNKKLNSGKFDNEFTRKKQLHMWSELVEKLNACFGAKKSIVEWKKCWLDMKRNAKEKASRIRNSREKTGGGRESSEKLSSLQERIISLMGDTVVLGQQNTVESEVEEFSNLLQTEESILPGIENLSATGVNSVDISSSEQDNEYIDLTKEASQSKGRKRKNNSNEDDLNEAKKRTESFIQLEEEKIKLKKKKLELREKELSIAEENKDSLKKIATALNSIVNLLSENSL
ncbi:uncharacterized protein LOC111641154 [Centruroides sculpturatus]|uniref:uncharacterized protein LOC111641154 n=2 Tax=Centruroides sculpturatus TaxID=218467 RepID=UPI000C6D4750|nr:uncharacterized protein LOC111641154 [Centruroides sculpturatus]